MNQLCRWIACVVLACGHAILVRGGPIVDVGYPVRLKLTCTTSISNRLVRTSLTERDLVSVCATQNAVETSRLQLYSLEISGQLAVVDVASSNIICGIATLAPNECLTNVFAITQTGSTGKGIVFLPFFSVGDGALPADFAGTLCLAGTAKHQLEGPSIPMYKGRVQGASPSKNCVYQGTFTLSGPVFLFTTNVPPPAAASPSPPVLH